jgi:hypothetical protein
MSGNWVVLLMIVDTAKLLVDAIDYTLVARAIRH